MTKKDLEAEIERLSKINAELEKCTHEANRALGEAHGALSRERNINNRLLQIMEHAAQEGNFPRKGNC